MARQYPGPVAEQAAGAETVPMSQFTASPYHIICATRPMHGISGAINDSADQIGAHAGAADECTSGGDALRGSFATWSDALPQFADAADRLIMAMTMSAAGYQTTDETIQGMAS
jgi:hypothetical protein